MPDASLFGFDLDVEWEVCLSLADGDHCRSVCFVREAGMLCSGGRGHPVHLVRLIFFTVGHGPITQVLDQCHSTVFSHGGGCAWAVRC